MAKIIQFVFSVGGLVTVLIGVVVWLRLRPTSRWARRWLVSITVFYTLASVYAVPHGAARLIAHGYHAFRAADVPAGRVAIVLLGAGEEFVSDWDGRLFPVESRAGVARIAETARVARLVPDAWIISSGGLPGLRPREQPSAVVMRDTLMQLGVPASRILLESESENTHDEAVLVAPMLTARQIDRVILVTSDVHMRRSIGTFHAAGIEAIPAIAQEPAWVPSWRGWLLPSPLGLETSSGVAHEIAGFAGYAVRGWYR
jgi:uncharacterized SAM-binding protein YcdF (DUF218 family)